MDYLLVFNQSFENSVFPRQLNIHKADREDAGYFVFKSMMCFINGFRQDGMPLVGKGFFTVWEKGLNIYDFQGFGLHRPAHPQIFYSGFP